MPSEIIRDTFDPGDPSEPLNLTTASDGVVARWAASGHPDAKDELFRRVSSAKEKSKAAAKFVANAHRRRGGHGSRQQGT